MKNIARILALIVIAELSVLDCDAGSLMDVFFDLHHSQCDHIQDHDSSDSHNHDCSPFCSRDCGKASVEITKVLSIVFVNDEAETFYTEYKSNFVFNYLDTEIQPPRRSII